MSESERLRSEMAATIEKKAIVEAEIALARRRGASGGGRVHPEWLAEKEVAVAGLKRRILELQARASAAVINEKHSRVATFERAFVDHAKLVLTGQQFSAISEAARLALQNTQGPGTSAGQQKEV